jgi:rhodanese-related sulfurtransferase
MKKRILTILVLALASTMIFNSCSRQQVYETADQMVEAAAKFVTNVAVDELKEMYDNGDLYTLIDVREPYEHNAGYIPGSINIPAGLLVFNIGKDAFWEQEMLYRPEKEELIIVYCKKGKRGTLAAKTLGDLGYKNVMNLDGGWKNWEMNFPLEYEKNLDSMHEPAHADEGGC